MYIFLPTECIKEILAWESKWGDKGEKSEEVGRKVWESKEPKSRAVLGDFWVKNKECHEFEA
jgi:hypothetical protein